MPPGFLAVASQPSPHLTLEEFHAWYDEEHIPIRLNRLASFISGARYHALDLLGNSIANKSRPGWLAMYEIDDTRTFSEESYTGLRLKRSEREEGVMNRLEVLTRKTGEVLCVRGEPALGTGANDNERGRTTGLRVGNPSKWIITHDLKVVLSGSGENTDFAAEKWVDGVTRKLKVETGGEGWVRTRLVKVLESGKTNMGTKVKLGEEEETLNYFVVHECFDQATATSEELKQIVCQFDKVSMVIADWRTWKLHKVYPSIAQGNVRQ